MVWNMEPFAPFWGGKGTASSKWSSCPTEYSTATDDSLDQLGLRLRMEPVDGGLHEQATGATGADGRRAVVDADTDRMQRRHLEEALAQQIDPVQVWQQCFVVHVQRHVETLRMAGEDRHRMVGTVVMLLLLLVSERGRHRRAEGKHTGRTRRGSVCSGQQFIFDLWKWCSDCGRCESVLPFEG